MLDDRPGTLAQLGEALGKANVNVEGVCVLPAGGGQATVHLLVEDATGARRAIEGAGLRVSAERDVVVVEMEDKPGTLGRTARRVADAGLNIDLAYLATRTRLVLGAADLAKLRSAVGSR
jgi:hypothetical protein